MPCKRKIIAENRGRNDGESFIPLMILVMVHKIFYIHVDSIYLALYTAPTRFLWFIVQQQLV